MSPNKILSKHDTGPPNKISISFNTNTLFVYNNFQDKKSLYVFSQITQQFFSKNYSNNIIKSCHIKSLYKLLGLALLINGIVSYGFLQCNHKLLLSVL